MPRILIIVGIVAVLAVAGIMWYGTSRPASVDASSPHIGTIRACVEEQAVTELPHDVLIAAPIDGWLQPISLREGDAVKQGDIIARLETDDINDRIEQATQRIADLESQIRKAKDNRLEQHALVETQATVVAIDQTVEAAEAKLAATKAIADFAESELHRIENLAEQGSAAPQELREVTTEYKRAFGQYRGDALDLAALKTLAAVSYIGPQFIRDYMDRKKFDVESLEQELAQARADLELEKRNRDRATMTAPIDGVVLTRHQTRHQFLPAGTPLLTLGRLDDMEVVADILTERATQISVGDPVEVFGDAVAGSLREATEHPDTQAADHATIIKGTVSRIFPAGFKKISSLGVEQQRVKVAIKLDHRPARLGVAFRVYVRIIYDQRDQALFLPRTALMRAEHGGWQVMRLRAGNKTELVDVEIGIANDESVEIVSGLDKADSIVARPALDD